MELKITPWNSQTSPVEEELRNQLAKQDLKVQAREMLVKLDIASASEYKDLK